MLRLSVRTFVRPVWCFLVHCLIYKVHSLFTNLSIGAEQGLY